MTTRVGECDGLPVFADRWCPPDDVYVTAEGVLCESQAAWNRISQTRDVVALVRNWREAQAKGGRATLGGFA